MKRKNFTYSKLLEAIRYGGLGKFLSFFLVLAFLNMLGGCRYYYKVTTSEDSPADVIHNQQDEAKFIILHFGDQAWEFTDIKVTEKTVVGTISELQGHEYYKTTRTDQVNRYKASKSEDKDESEVLNEVHITVSEYTALDDNEVSVSLENIEKIEIYDRAAGATTASWIFGGLGVAAGVLAVITIIAVLTKSSCPFIYVYNGTNYEFCGEIYSGAIQPPLERHDYLPLHELREIDNLYKIQMKNEVHEIQHTNLSELIVVDHPPESEVLIDKYGNLCTINNPYSPLSATNLEGNDILPQILAKDSLSYSGYDPGKDPNLTDGAIMEFEIPEEADSLMLSLRAKNSFWLDYLFTRFHALFGSEYDSYMNKQAEATRLELMERMFDQKLPISVSIEKDGEWVYQDYFNVAGPMALRDDILSLDVSDISSGQVRIRLEYGLYFWELDYVGIDFKGDEKIMKQVVQLESAFDGKNDDVKDLLIADDSLYYIQPDIGDVVEMTFKVPASKGMQRSVFLHSKGHYKIIRDQTGAPDLKTLRSLNSENGLPQYSLELIKALYPPSQN
jgi:hypothetical protein